MPIARLISSTFNSASGVRIPDPISLITIMRSVSDKSVTSTATRGLLITPEWRRMLSKIMKKISVKNVNASTIGGRIGNSFRHDGVKLSVHVAHHLKTNIYELL